MENPRNHHTHTGNGGGGRVAGEKGCRPDGVGCGAHCDTRVHLVFHLAEVQQPLTGGAVQSCEQHGRDGELGGRASGFGRGDGQGAGDRAVGESLVETRG